MEDKTVELAVYGQLEADLIGLEEANKEMKFDVSTPDGEADCSAWYKKLRKGWNVVEKLRKATKADYVRIGKEVDAEADEFKDRFDAMAKPHKALLDAKQAEEDAKIAKIVEDKRLEDERIENERVADLKRREEEADRKEAELKKKMDELKAAEDKVANDKRIADTAKQATIDAEAKAASDKIEAAELAEREKQEAVEAEKEKQRLAEVERVRIEKEKANAETKRIAEAEAEMNRLAKIEADRVADVEHRETIEIAIIDALKEIIDHAGLAGEVMDAIRSGKIPKVSIQY